MYKSGKNITIKIDDITINYNDLGQGKIPVIFIHGFPFDKSMWDNQLEHLQATHRAIAFDIRGYGESTSSEEKVTVSLLADDLIKFMDALQIRKAIVCGLSMGGYIVLNALNRYANRFAAIILSNTQCIADSPEAREKRLKNIQLIEKGGLTEYIENSIKNLFHEDSFLHKQKIVSDLRNVMLKTKPEIICNTLHALANRAEMCSMLETVNIVPTLIISGRDDKAIPMEQSVFLHQKISRSIVHIIDKAGHLTNLEQPGEFNRLTKDFIDGVSILYLQQPASSR